MGTVANHNLSTGKNITNMMMVQADNDSEITTEGGIF